VQNDAYSQFVSWAKVVLPLSAIVLLSTLFLIARNVGDTSQIPYADIEEIARQPRLSAPKMVGMSETGGTYTIEADVARQDPDTDNGLIAEAIVVNMATIDGIQTTVSAGIGKLDSDAKVVTLDNLARVTTSDGYLMETRGLVTSLTDGSLETTDPLEVRAPYGSLTAGRLTITPDSDEPQLIVFNNGVRLIYQPQPEE
jgi:lipopolysaccharide export system protein LptC